MRRFLTLFFFVFGAVICNFAAPVFAAESASQFSTVASNDPLQTELQIVRRAGWGNLGLSATPAGSTPVATTRYEMALETAKAIIAVRARHNADESWDQTADPRALRALRSLCVAFKNELASFEIAVPDTLDLLDEILADAEKTVPKTASAITDKTDARRVSGAGSTPGAPDGSLLQSLSQRLRIYSALDSLARQQSDPFSKAPTAFSVRPDSSFSGGVQRLRARAVFEVTPSLQLRADFQDENAQAARAGGLRDFLSDTADTSFDDPFRINARSMGAGVDLNLLPGVTVSGGVSRVDEWGNGSDALRYEGGVGLSGWQNRVALSAHLSRLVPEDSLALGATAARLNLGVGLTSQIQLKLMYQQMFGAGAALQSNQRFGGGLDFRF